MARKRYRYDHDLDAVVEINDHNGPHVTQAHNFVPDIKPFVTQEGVHITSRSKLREYERANGVKQVGNDWTGSTKPTWWDAYQRGELRG